MSFAEPQVESWDPAQGDLGRPHVLYTPYEPETKQQLISAGWTPCPQCRPTGKNSGQAWINPDTKAEIQSSGGYYTCPKCRQNSDLMENLPWHGVEEEDYYPRRGTGGGTAIGLPMDDVGQIGENIVQGMKEIPGYGPIRWWHPGGSANASPLDGATDEWGIEVKSAVYDAASHFWHPGSKAEGEIEKKDQAAAEMGLKGVLGVLVVENFRNDTADVYVRAMPITPWVDGRGVQQTGIAKWHKSTGEKVASGVPFENPYKDPANPSPGPYSMENYYQRPQAPDFTPPEDMPF